VPEAYKHLCTAFDRVPAGIASPVHEQALQNLNRSRSGVKAVS
jgi:hypothetical protein